MSFFKKNITCFLISACLLTTFSVLAQDCDSNYSSYLYSSSDFVTYSKAVAAPDNSFICLQTNKLYQHGLTKFTPQGNVIYAYEYTAPLIPNGYHSWTDLIFTDLAVAPDGTTYTVGSVTKHGVFFDNTETPPARTAATLCKIDKYGAVIWSRFIANSIPDPLAFSNVIILANGDIVCYLTTQAELPYYGRVVCFSLDGTMKWIITLNTGNYSTGQLAPAKKIAFQQIKNGDIVIGDVATYYHPDLTVNNEFHFIALHPSNGAVAWESSYDYEQSGFIPNILSIYELPNQNLSFQTTWNLITGGNTSLSVHLNIITDSKGIISKMIATHPMADFIVPLEAKPDDKTGNQGVLMFASDGNAVLTTINKDGKLMWSRKYGKLDNQVPPACFTKINNHYNIVLSDFARSFRMLVTDQIGRLDCDSFFVNLIQEELTPFASNFNNIHTIDSVNSNLSPYYTGFFIVQNTITTSIQRSIVCKKNIPCCTDFVDTININKVSLCENGTYTLPDKTIVKDSGLYYYSVTTEKGCDSIILYNVRFYKNPSSLSLGLDTCFDNSNSLTLHATDGYDNYSWMHNLLYTSSQYTVRQPGTYYVTVSNACGTNTDSVHVYEQCNFPIYMPNAFTPNGDLLNDVFKVPLLNLNRFIRLTIYNRWGKAIFQTQSVQKGWDGTVKGFPQGKGVYIYYLEMENLLGKKVIQKGIISLIR